MLNYKLLSALVTVVIAVLGIFKSSIRLNPVQFTCDNYVLTSYLYIVLSMAIVASVIFSYEHFQISPVFLFSNILRLFIMVAVLGLVVVLATTNAKHFWSKHLFFMAFLIAIATLLYPLFVMNPQTFYHAGFQTVCIVLVLTFIALLAKDWIHDSVGSYLFIALIILLCVSIGELILRYFNILQLPNSRRIISYLTIVLFAGFILFDTKSILQAAGKCVNADYISQSLNIFLDSLNIFAALTHLGN